MKITIKEVGKYFKKSKHWPIAAIILVAIVGIIFSVYYIFIYSNVCQDDICFSESLVKCKRTIYIKDNTETITQYSVEGKKSGDCSVNVKILQIKQGALELVKIEGGEMDCLMPLGAYALPEDNIQNCHGTLKEGIQEIMIQRMHSQLIENIGEIGEEVTKVL